jgi:hypothetical protein
MESCICPRQRMPGAARSRQTGEMAGTAPSVRWSVRRSREAAAPNLSVPAKAGTHNHEAWFLKGNCKVASTRVRGVWVPAFAGTRWSRASALDSECLARRGRDRPATLPERVPRAGQCGAREKPQRIISVSPRKRGPITTGLGCCGRQLPGRLNKRPRRMGARFRGDGAGSDPVYRFLFAGFRFSMNAAMPSERSSSAKVA